MSRLPNPLGQRCFLYKTGQHEKLKTAPFHGVSTPAAKRRGKSGPDYPCSLLPCHLWCTPLRTAPPPQSRAEDAYGVLHFAGRGGRPHRGRVGAGQIGETKKILFFVDIFLFLRTALLLPPRLHKAGRRGKSRAVQRQGQKQRSINKKKEFNLLFFKEVQKYLAYESLKSEQA